MTDNAVVDSLFNTCSSRSIGRSNIKRPLESPSHRPGRRNLPRVRKTVGSQVSIARWSRASRVRPVALNDRFFARQRRRSFGRSPSSASSRDQSHRPLAQQFGGRQAASSAGGRRDPHALKHEVLCKGQSENTEKCSSLARVHVGDRGEVSNEGLENRPWPGVSFQTRQSRLRGDDLCLRLERHRRRRRGRPSPSNQRRR